MFSCRCADRGLGALKKLRSFQGISILIKYGCEDKNADGTDINKYKM